jgi:hypothetical protein
MSMGFISPGLHTVEHAIAGVTGREIAFGIAIFVLSLIGSLAVAAFVLCRLPEDYLRRDESAFVQDGRPLWKRALIVVGKNLLGGLLVVLGIVLSLPGVPGQGVLTILTGVLLLDIPGKKALERWLFKKPSVLRAINRLRARFGRPALLPAESDG